MAKNLENRFWEKVSIKGKDDCWVWQANTNRGGYGQIQVDGRSHLSHRIAYTLSKGPISEGMVVCHSCDNPSCCNPNHLWVGTVADNNEDRDKKGRAFRDFHKSGGDHPSAKLTDDNRKELERLRKEGKSYREIGQIFNVSHIAVYKALNKEYRDKNNLNR